MMNNRAIRSLVAAIATTSFMLQSVAVGYADIARSQAAAIAALVDNPNPHRTTGELFRWLTEVDVRYYGVCGTDGAPKVARGTELESFLEEITEIGADLSFNLRISGCESDIEPARPDSFGVAVIVGGGMPRVRKLLSAGSVGDGSELVVAGMGEDPASTGCFSSAGKMDGTGRILAAVVYVDPSMVGAESNLCIRVAVLGALGFTSGRMAPYPETLLSTRSRDLSDLDRCLIATFYSRELEPQRPTLADFTRQLPELMRTSKYCE